MAGKRGKIMGETIFLKVRATLSTARCGSLLLLLLIQSALCLAVCADSKNVGVIWRDPYGPAQDVWVVGDNVYLAAGGALIVFEVNNLSQVIEITEVGKTVTPGDIREIYIDGIYAYAITYEDGLFVIDISDPTNPEQVSSLDKFVYSNSVHVSGDYAYVSDNSGLHVIDVSNPARLKEVAVYEGPEASYGLHVADGYAYVANDNLHIIDISDPEDPRETAVFNTQGGAFSVYVKDNYAYVSDSGSKDGLVMLDISDPVNPRKVSSLRVHGGDIHIVGDYAYVADWSGGGLFAVDISNPEEPTEVGHFPARWSRGIYFAGGYVYLTDGADGLHIIDAADPERMEEVHTYEVHGLVESVWVENGYAFVADASTGIRVFNVTNPANPREAAVYEAKLKQCSMSLVGDYIYASDQSEGLLIIDITNPENPRKAGSIGRTMRPHALHISGDYAYTLSGSTMLHIIDISDAKNPREISATRINEIAGGIWVVGKYAYIANGKDGLMVYDISDPEKPSRKARCDTPEWAYGVYVRGDYAYVADLNAGLQIIDISSPRDPEIMAEYPARMAFRVSVKGSCAYVVENLDGIRVIDVSDPENPLEVGYYDTPGYALDVHVDGRYAYVADGNGGLWIMEYTGECKDMYPQAVHNEPEISAGLKPTRSNENINMLYQNIPNPFNPDTWMPYQLAEGTNVAIDIYSSNGRSIRTLELGFKPAGRYLGTDKAAYWNGENDRGERVASGLYFYKLRTDNFFSMKKMVLAQ